MGFDLLKLKFGEICMNLKNGFGVTMLGVFGFKLDLVVFMLWKWEVKRF